MRSEQDRFRDDTEEAIARLRSRVEELEKERSDLNCKLEDERRYLLKLFVQHITLNVPYDSCFISMQILYEYIFFLFTEKWRIYNFRLKKRPFLKMT